MHKQYFHLVQMKASKRLRSNQPKNENGLWQKARVIPMVKYLDGYTLSAIVHPVASLIQPVLALAYGSIST